MSSISALAGAIDLIFPPIEFTVLVTVIWQCGLFMLGIVRLIVSIFVCLYSNNDYQLSFALHINREELQDFLLMDGQDGDIVRYRESLT